MKKIAGVLAVAGVLVLTGCAEERSMGPAGRVTDKESRSWTTGVKHKTRHYDYELTVTAKDGKSTTFEVSSDHYGRCYRGSAYPSCTTKTERD